MRLVSGGSWRGPSFFEGLSHDERAEALTGVSTRAFPADTYLVREGEVSECVYVITSGTAVVSITAAAGVVDRLGRIGPGSTVGEMSVFSGQPASADVRALTDVEVFSFAREDFFRVATAFPQIYLNLGAVLSQRLARSDHRSGSDHEVRVVMVDDRGAPPLAAYALAASMAWHMQRPVTFLMVDRDLSPEFVSLATRSAPRNDAGAYIEVLQSDGRSPTHTLVAYLDQRPDDTSVVMVVAPPGTAVPFAHRQVRILSAQANTQDQAPSPLQVVAWSDPSWYRAERGVTAAPVPNASDVVTLRRGLLPIATPTGEALGRVARDLADLQVGVALGAGSAKGYAHIGVLGVLARSNVPIDYLAGASIGAAVAGMASVGDNAATCEKLLDSVGRSTFRPTVSTKALMSSTRVRRLMQTVWGERRLEDLHTPLTIVATDILLGQEVLLRRGLLWSAVLASIAIPGIYPPQRLGRHVLVDGGLVNPVPSNVVAAMGADVVIGVKLTDRRSLSALDVEAVPAHGRLPNAAQIMLRSIEIMQAGIKESSASTATVVVEPRFDDASGFGLRDFSRGRRYVHLGEVAAEQAVVELAAALPWLRAQ